MKHCSGPWGLSRPIALGLFTAWQIFEFWTEGRTDLQQGAKFLSWRVDSKYISFKKIGQRVPEILSSEGKTLFRGKIQAKKFRPNSGPRNFKKSPGNHSIMEGMNGMNWLLLWFCPKREFLYPLPPLIGDFAKNRKINGNSSIGVNILGWGGWRVGLWIRNDIWTNVYTARGY